MSLTPSRQDIVDTLVAAGMLFLDSATIRQLRKLFELISRNGKLSNNQDGLLIGIDEITDISVEPTVNC